MLRAIDLPEQLDHPGAHSVLVSLQHVKGALSRRPGTADDLAASKQVR